MMPSFFAWWSGNTRDWRKCLFGWWWFFFRWGYQALWLMPTWINRYLQVWALRPRIVPVWLELRRYPSSNIVLLLLVSSSALPYWVCCFVSDHGFLSDCCFSAQPCWLHCITSTKVSSSRLISILLSVCFFLLL